MYVRLSVRLSIHPSIIHRYIYLSIFIYFVQSVCLYMCLRVFVYLNDSVCLPNIYTPTYAHRYVHAHINTYIYYIHTFLKFIYFCVIYLNLF